ncbi:DUF397 domain-containing protein [Streptomyces sp. NPDC048291]|uniref:DUF397 domain-containing protein n=1 Tax=Streptomyces sp. NPDC048291 TaxID=3365530 RepID=UPI0037231C8B
MSTPSTAAPHDVTAAPHDVDLTHLRWRKSSYSGGANDCVEVADLANTTYAGVAIRDSKVLQGPVLIVAVDSFAAFIQGVDHAPQGA